MKFQKISIPTSWKVNGNSEGPVVDLKSQNFKKESMGLTGKWNFQRGGGIQIKKPFRFLEQHNLNNI